MPDWVAPEIQRIVKWDIVGEPTKWHLCNTSKLSQEELWDVADQIRRDGLPAIEAERLPTPLGKKSGDRQVIADHQL